MAYMVREGLADFAITEDSDLLAFGCTRTVVKLNFKGAGEMFDMDQFRWQNNNSNKDGWNENLRTLQKLNRDEFVNLCVMGGCQYLKSIDWIGLKVILHLLTKIDTTVQVIHELKNYKSFKDKVPDNYLADVQKARSVFKFQTVYDPRIKRFVSLEQP